MIEFKIKILGSGYGDIVAKSDLPGFQLITGFGASNEEALKDFAVALKLALEIMIEDGGSLNEKLTGEVR